MKESRTQDQLSSLIFFLTEEHKTRQGCPLKSTSVSGGHRLYTQQRGLRAEFKESILCELQNHNHEVLPENIFSDKQLFHDCLISLRANQTTWANNNRDFLMPARLVHASHRQAFPQLLPHVWKL